jgi:methylated-DNA-[protein]-cysteine S-methyltransferase
MALISCLIPTEAGEFTAIFTTKGLAKLSFPTSTPARRSGNDRVSRKWLEQTRAAIEAVLHGRKVKSLPPLDLDGTEFQRAVWNALREIPAGQTMSYSDVARRIGRPAAVRAVGGACGANPIPLLIPCHRVLAKGEMLGGFSGGLEWKKRLLQAERIYFNTN